MEFLFEATSGAVDDNSGLTDQAIEVEADAFAGTICFFDFVARNDDPPRSVGERTYQWLFAVSSAILLLGCKFDPDRLSAMDHPPPPMRMLLIQRQIVNHLKHLGDVFDGRDPSKKVMDKKSVDDVEKAFHVAMTDTRVAFEMLGGSLDGELSDFRTMASSGEYHRHTKAISERALEIYPAIKTFGYGNVEFRAI
jgi:hypothetical protein